MFIVTEIFAYQYLVNKKNVVAKIRQCNGVMSNK